MLARVWVEGRLSNWQGEVRIYLDRDAEETIGRTVSVALPIPLCCLSIRKCCAGFAAWILPLAQMKRTRIMNSTGVVRAIEDTAWYSVESYYLPLHARCLLTGRASSFMVD